MSARGQPASLMRGLPTPLIAILGPALGGAFLIPRPWIGAVLWFGIFQNLRYAAFALLGVAIAEGIARAFRISDASPITGSLKANALLATVAVAWLTEPVAASITVQIALAVASSVAATILTAAIVRVMTGLRAPPLTLSYCIVATMLFATFPHWTYHAVAATEWWPVPTDLLGWVVTFFRTLGALLFSPTLEVGIVIAVAMLLWSRIAFAAGLIGWITGIATAVALNQQGVIYYWMPTAYNFFLAGAALGAVFFLPGRASLPMAAVAGCTSSLIAVGLQHLLPQSAFGYLPLATILTIWIRMYALALASDQSFVQQNREIHLPPEEAWWRWAYWRRRSGHGGPLLIVPLSGPVEVSQGTDGMLSHVGPWRYALDFQRPRLLSSDASEATIWNAPVFAPASGIVARVRDGIADNPLGICNYAEHWGNHVIIHLDQGGWALLAHLQQASITVKPGMRVELGAHLGAVGNSGRSPIPHLHLQFQGAADSGAPTLPFRLANFVSATDPTKPLLQWHPVAIPGQGAIVALALPNAAVHATLASTAPGTAVWSVECDGLIPRAFRDMRAASTKQIFVSLDAAGRHRYRGRTGGALVASLDPDAWRVLELEHGTEPLLKLLALAVPSVPYAAITGMTWEEVAPLAPSGTTRWVGLPLSPYLQDPFAAVRCQCISGPEGEHGIVAIETHVETAWHWLPTKLTCQFDRLRGPIHLEALFPAGRATFTLLSFEPGLPFGDEAT